MTKEAPETQKIEKSTEFKVKEDPHTILAKEEEEEFPDESTNERHDYVKEYENARAAFGE